MRISDWSSDVCSSDLVCLEPDLPAALDDARVEGVPELDLRRHASRHFDRPVLGFGRQSDDDVEGTVLEFVEGLGLVPRQVEADLVEHLHGEGIEFAAPDADGIDIDVVARQIDRKRTRLTTG